MKDSNEINLKLAEWHKEKIKVYKIDSKHNRREQEGAMKVVADIAKELDKNEIISGIGNFFGGVAKNTLGLDLGKVSNDIRREIDYIPIKKATIKMIDEQKNISYTYTIQNHYTENVELLVENDKVYYLLHKN